MKKLASVFLMLGCLYANARQISPGEALTFASDFMNSAQLQSASGSKSMKPMKTPGINVEGQITPYYVFNRGESDGFVIISGDDRAPKILGYSDRGCFDADNIPPQLKAMMDQWSVLMSNLPMSASKHSSWSATSKTRSGDAILLETAEWGQGYPFNALCPVIDGEQAPTGCIATAMAIAMKYHNWPDATRGESEDDFESSGVSFDFSNYSIDWNVLSDQNNTGFAQEVSTLMLSLGVASQMHYGSQESYAYDWPYAHKMIEKYSYAKGCQFIEKSSFSDAEWLSMLHEQLSNVGPVIYRGSGTDVGHAFIIDGYDGSSLYHVNWGWDGLMNGYFTLDFEDMGFDQYQGMVINIIPDKEHHVYSKAFLPNVQAYTSGQLGCGDWNFMNPNIIPGEKNRVRLPDLCANNHDGAYGIAVVDDDDNILQILDGFTYNSGYRYVCPWPGSDDAIDIVFPELKQGERFQLVSSEIPSSFFPGYAPVHEATKDPKDWRIVLGGIVRPSHFYMTGNHSDVSEVNFHIDEKLPFMFVLNSKAENEFSLKELKGHCVADNIMIPSKGVTYDIKCYDKEGNSEEPSISIGDFLGGNYLSFNISMYSQKCDFYLNYEYDGDTRKIGELPSDSIVEQDGLVYHILKDGVSLIGFDKIPEVLTIPDHINIDNVVLPLVEIEKEALMFAPIKELTIKASNLEKIDHFAFAGIEGLNTVSFEDAHYSTNHQTLPFLKSGIKNVYFDTHDVNGLLHGLIGLNLGNNESYVVNNNDIAFYISQTFSNPDDVYQISDLLVYLRLLSDYGCEKSIDRFYFPGFGSSTMNEYLKTYNIPFAEMWSYAIDKLHGLIAIKDPISIVSVDKVIINGIVVQKNAFGLYEIPVSENNATDVIVEYTVNGVKKMSTHYSSDYNFLVQDSNLKPFICGDSNGDWVVNIADAVNCANYIVGLPTTDFDFESADINSDGYITISDVTSIISLIPSQTYAAKSYAERLLVKGYEDDNLVAMVSDFEGSLDLSLTSYHDLTALQFDLVIPTESPMPEIILSDGFASTHSLYQYHVAPNIVRVILYSPSGKSLSADCNRSILSLRNGVSLSECEFVNLFASDATGASIILGFEDMDVSNGVSETIVGPIVSIKDGGLCVSKAEGKTVSVYSMDGVCVGSYNAVGENLLISLASGMYVVTIDNRSLRVIIK